MFLQEKSDYFPIIWENPEKYEEQLDLLSNEKNWSNLAASNEGLIHLNLFQRIWEVVKGLLGFTVLNEKHRVSATIFKLIGFAQFQHNVPNSVNQKLDQIKKQFSSSNSILDDFFIKIFKEKSKITSKVIKEKINLYYKNNEKFFKPDLWTRLTEPQLLPAQQFFQFGQTSLLLAKKAREEKRFQECLDYIKQAIALGSDQPSVRREISSEMILLKQDKDFLAADDSRELFNLWMELADRAFQDHHEEEAVRHLFQVEQGASPDQQRRIGELYLAHNLPQNAIFYLPRLHDKIEDISELKKMAQAHYIAENYNECFQCYEKALHLSEKNLQNAYINKLNPLEINKLSREVAELYHEIGLMYFDNLIVPAKDGAIEYFEKALKNYPEDPKYRKNLFKAYVKEFSEIPSSFFDLYGKKWCEFLSFFDQKDNSTKKAKEMLLQGVKEYLSAGKFEEALDYVRQGTDLFADHENFLIEMLSLVSDSKIAPTCAEHYKNRFTTNQFTTNEYIVTLMADCYWETDKKQAIELYEKAIDLFNRRLSASSNENNIKGVIAGIEAKIALFQLEQNPTDEKALLKLSRAAQVNRIYNFSLSDAYLKAVAQEKGRWLKNPDKIINYSIKAFEANPVQGSYLRDLIDLLAEKKKDTEFYKIYQIIEQQPWKKDFKFSAGAYLCLARFYLKDEQYSKAKEAIKQIEQMASENEKVMKEVESIEKELYQKDENEWVKKAVNHLNANEYALAREAIEKAKWIGQTGTTHDQLYAEIVEKEIKFLRDEAKKQKNENRHEEAIKTLKAAFQLNEKDSKSRKDYLEAVFDFQTKKFESSRTLKGLQYKECLQECERLLSSALSVASTQAEFKTQFKQQLAILHHLLANSYQETLINLTSSKTQVEKSKTQDEELKKDLLQKVSNHYDQSLLYNSESPKVNFDKASFVDLIESNQGKAFAFYKKAHELNPENAFYTKALAYQHKQRFDGELARELEESINTDRYPTIHADYNAWRDEFLMRQKDKQQQKLNPHAY